jgi:hypothetical protein
MQEMLAFLAETIFCALRHKKLPVGKKNMVLDESPTGAF